MSNKLKLWVNYLQEWDCKKKKKKNEVEIKTADFVPRKKGAKAVSQNETSLLVQ